MSQLSQKDLQFCFDELLGELGWGDEVAETGVDPLAWARNEIKDLHKTIKRLRGSLELRNAAEQTLAPDGACTCDLQSEIVSTIHETTCPLFYTPRR